MGDREREESVLLCVCTFWKEEEFARDDPRLRPVSPVGALDSRH